MKLMTELLEYVAIESKGVPIPLFSCTFDNKYRDENFTDTNSDINAYRQCWGRYF